MGDRPRPSEQDLQDYLDGRLDPACQAEIATYLADHPETAARVERYRAQVAGLHALYDGILSEPIPAGIRAALQQAAARRRRPRLAVAAAAAVAALVMAGVVALRWGGSERVEGELAAAQEAHLQFTTASSPGSDVAELGDETVARVLSERLGAAVILPEAARAGFTLTAVHLLPPPHRAALLLYRDAANHIASLYITAGAQEDERGGDAAAGGVHTFFRNARGVFYALSVSNAEPDETLRRAFAMGP
jgi:anti-sigma factor RsiW